MYLNVCVCDGFSNCQKWQKMKFGLFHPYFVFKFSFREISIIKMVILYQSKPISLIFKIQKSKILKFKTCKLHVYYS